MKWIWHLQSISQSLNTCSTYYFFLRRWIGSCIRFLLVPWSAGSETKEVTGQDTILPKKLLFQINWQEIWKFGLARLLLCLWQGKWTCSKILLLRLEINLKTFLIRALYIAIYNRCNSWAKRQDLFALLNLLFSVK